MRKISAKCMSRWDLPEELKARIKFGTLDRVADVIRRGADVNHVFRVCTFSVSRVARTLYMVSFEEVCEQQHLRY